MNCISMDVQGPINHGLEIVVMQRALNAQMPGNPEHGERSHPVECPLLFKQMRGPRGDRHLPGTSPEAESFFIEFDYAVVVPTNDQQRRDRNSSERHRPGQIRTTAARDHNTKPGRRNQCGRAPGADAKVANGTVPELRLRA